VCQLKTVSAEGFTPEVRLFVPFVLFWASRHDLDCSKLLEVMIEGKRHRDIELFHDDFACAVGEAPVLVVEPLECLPRKRQISGRDLMYFRQTMPKKSRTWHAAEVNAARAQAAIVGAALRGRPFRGLCVFPMTGGHGMPPLQNLMIDTPNQL
jgi:hypothetical protein